MTKLTLRYLRIHQRYMLAAILGLLLASLIVSQVILLNSSIHTNTTEALLFDQDLPLIDAYVEYEYHSQQFFDLNYAKFEELVQDEDMIVDRFISVPDSRYDVVINESIPDEDFSVEFKPLSLEIFEYMELFPSFSFDQPYNESLVIVVVEPWVDDIFGEIINFPTTLKFTRSSFQDDVTIDYVWYLTSDDITSVSRSYTWHLLNRVRRSVLVHPDNLDTIFNILGFEHMKYSGYVAIGSILNYTPRQLIQKSFNIETKYDIFFETNGGDYVRSELRWELVNVEQDLQLTSFASLLVAVPMSVIALFLVYYSLSLVEMRKSRLAAIMKMRGMSQQQLILVMMTETILTAVAGAIIGMLISIPLTSIGLSGLSLYGNNLDDVNIPGDWWWKVPLITCILAIDLNITSIRQISVVTVEEGELVEEIKQPAWRRLNIDVMLFSLGLIFWGAVKLADFLSEVRLFLLSLGGPLVLIISLVSIPLIISRFFSDILATFSSRLWNGNKSIFTLALKNLGKTKFSSSKLMALLVLGLMLSIVSFAIPTILSQAYTDQSYYDVGSDFYIEGLNSTNPDHLKVLHNESIESYSRTAQERITIFSGSLEDVNLLAINTSSFADAAYWRQDFADNDLTVLISILNQGDALGQKDYLNILGTEVGDEFAIRSVENKIYRFNITGTFGYFPTLVDYIYVEPGFVNEMYIVVSLETYLQIFNDTETRSFLVKIKPEIDHIKFRSYLQAELGPGIIVKSAEDLARYNSETSPLSVVFIALVDTLQLITLTSTLIALGFFIYLGLEERRREIAVFRALGMVRNQIFRMLVVEALILILVSMCIGLLSGLYIVDNILLIFNAQIGYFSIPFILKLPIVGVSLFLGFMFIGGIISAIVPTYQLSSKQTGSILRAQ